MVPLDQMLNISINTEELPTLQGWRTGTIGQTLTPTKSTQIAEPTREAIEEEDESAHKPKSQSEPDPTLEESRSPQPSVLDDIAAAARWVLAENRNIAQW